MRAALAPFLLLVLVACGAPAAPTAPVEPGPPASLVAPGAPPAQREVPLDAPVEQHAMEIMRLLQACDRDAVRARAITYQEITELTTKDVEPNEIDDALTKLMDDECQAAKASPKQVVSARVIELRHLTKAETSTLKKDVDAADVAITFEAGGEQTERERPLVFFKTDRGWRFSPKH